MNLLEVKNICKTYGNGETAVKALKDVSFSVPKGEYVAIVGESGSGKSTLLNMIGALDTPTSGKVLIDGKDIFSMNDKKLTVFRRRNIGFVFQAFNLVPELTVEQNIIFPVLLDYQKPDKKYLEELLAVLNLKERRNHLPSQLSGGQQQRGNWAALITSQPRCVCYCAFDVALCLLCVSGAPVFPHGNLAFFVAIFSKMTRLSAGVGLRLHSIYPSITVNRNGGVKKINLREELYLMFVAIFVDATEEVMETIRAANVSYIMR